MRQEITQKFRVGFKMKIVVININLKILN